MRTDQTPPAGFKEGARVTLPDGRRAIVTTRHHPTRGLLVIVRPIKGA